MEIDEKTLRILGKRGRVTIPQEIRDAIGMARGDVVSFAVVGDDCALVKRERICDNWPCTWLRTAPRASGLSSS